MSSTGLWSSAEAAALTDGVARGVWRVGGVAIDTRELRPGDLFVALQGVSRDGHIFVANALAKGAGAALVSRADGLPADAPLLVVEDTLRGLERLAGAARRRANKLSAIAVTGSVGKTSTKEMLAAMLRPQGPTHAAERSFNNHWGVPLTLARMPRKTRFGVFEIGMNHPGEIAPLSILVAPDVAVVTAVEAVHLAAFANVAQIAEAKAEIFAGLKQGGVAVLPHDNPHFDLLARRAEESGAAAIRCFGAEGGDARLLAYRATEEGLSARVEIDGRERVMTMATRGAHMVENALAALLAAQAAGADVEKCFEILAAWRATEGRGDRWRLALPAGDALLIDESYNANPTSMRAAFALLGEAKVGRGRRLAFLTDMLELGQSGADLHAELAEAVVAADIDRVYCAGPLMRALFDALPQERRGAWVAEADELADRAVGLVRRDDVVMVKGSKGSRAHLVASRLRVAARAARAQVEN